MVGGPRHGRPGAPQGPGLLACALLLALAGCCLAADTEDIDTLVPAPYTLERRTVLSAGYRLAVFRLGRAGGPSPAGRPALLLHHGWVFSASAWLPLPADQGAPYLLFEEGYDVWALSDRGTTYSRSHETLSPAGKDFWRYSLDDLALVDLPAVVDAVRGWTGQAKIATISWSAGGLQTFAWGAHDPSAAAAALCAHVTLGPVVFPQRLKAPLLAGLLGSGADRVVLPLDLQRLGPGVNEYVLGPLCAAQGHACDAALGGFYGPPAVADKATARRIAAVTWPSTLGTPVLAQLARSYRLGPLKPVLLRYDYGVDCREQGEGSPPHLDDPSAVPPSPPPPAPPPGAGWGLGKRVLPDWDGTCNRKVYGSDLPPPYDLTRYDVPTTIIGGDLDIVSVPWDREHVAEAIRTQGALRAQHSLSAHAHLDFTFSDARAWLGLALEAIRGSC
ncbi:hypothetical protein HYH03_016327 [Edaphochlamys debaryana]|uniref:AB hydrolase-1 domain-containing protein n=1 Tax=Edaphochlamys debaryana TaxID=47281 RepID=A0A835XMI7_9CHLO|nr:hypothetical protein HYH03_016327 [Edaphochlamys debaryana]|eukprot:KAG2484941.1 hypothetical protein HYH03_016327 [Edaphochlamys debaryana]